LLEPGSEFPKFDLEAHDGSRVRLTDLAGRKVLLFYYPKADTPGCTKEACAFRDAWGELKAAGVAIYGISFDKPNGNAHFADKYGLPFLLLTDAGKAIAKQVGATGLLMPVPKRISYLLDENGNVLKAYPTVRPVGHAEEVLADVEALS